MKIGEMIGPYRVLEKLGEGGMGEVYTARDTRLGRDVAIKVLPEQVAADPTALARFEREARAIATLSHPNILAVFDVGQSPVAYVVTELLEGQTLRQRMAEGALPVRKAIDYAAQVADGLAAAHDKGIVHRDIKPDNLFVTRDERVKVLDFGLARHVIPGASRDANASQDAADDAAAGQAPTRAALTGAHMAVGTVGYMAPEQIRAQAVDHRTDLFSFGATLYEMLTGRRAFAGATPPDTMSAILGKDPAPLSPPDGAPLPPSLERIVLRCLEKDPAARFQSTTDLAFALKALASPSSSSSALAVAAAAPAVAADRSWRRLALRTAGAVAAAALVFVAGAATVSYLQGDIPDLGVYRLTPFATDAEPESRPVWSPDGKSIAYLKKLDSQYQVFVRTVTADSPTQITRLAEGAASESPPTIVALFFDSAVVPKIWLLPIPDGPTASPRRLFAGRTMPWKAVPTATWMADSRRLVMAGDDALWMVDTQTEVVRPVLPGVSPLSAPNVSPDGQRMAIVAGGPDYDIVEMPLDGSPVKDVLATSLREDAPVWIPRSGSFAYFASRAGELQVRLRNTTESWDRAVVTPRDIVSTGGSRLLALAASPDGSLLAYDAGNSSLWISPLAGGVPVRAAWGEDTGWPMWSRDGKWLGYMSQEPKTGARRLAKSRFGSNEAPQMLTGPRTFSAKPGGPAIRPSWSPTGEWIVFQVPDAVMLVDAEGRNEHVLARLRCSAFGWSSDGKTVYAVTSAEPRQSLTAIDVKTGTPRTITTLAADSPIAAAQNASLTLTLSPDSKSLLASVARTKTDIWILDGFDTRRGLFGWWKR